MYVQIGQQEILVFCPNLALSGVNISMYDKVSHECSSCRSPSEVTLLPSNTTMVKGHLRSFAFSNRCLILQALAADFGPVIMLECGGLVQ